MPETGRTALIARVRGRYGPGELYSLWPQAVRETGAERFVRLVSLRWEKAAEKLAESLVERVQLRELEGKPGPPRKSGRAASARRPSNAGALPRRRGQPKVTARESMPPETLLAETVSPTAFGKKKPKTEGFSKKLSKGRPLPPWVAGATRDRERPRISQPAPGYPAAKVQGGSLVWGAPAGGARVDGESSVTPRPPQTGAPPQGGLQTGASVPRPAAEGAPTARTRGPSPTFPNPTEGGATPSRWGGNQHGAGEKGHSRHRQLDKDELPLELFLRERRRREEALDEWQRTQF